MAKQAKQEFSKYRKVEEQKKKKSLVYSILDGSYYSVMAGFGESFFSTFAVFLKATNVQLGLIGALPQALASLFQLFSNKLLYLFGSRKRLVCVAALLQSLMLIPIALVYYLGVLRIYHLILFISLYWIFGMMTGPAWSSWMGDLVKENERGKYFGKRNMITGFISFFAFLLAGFLLQQFSHNQVLEYYGFFTLFIIAVSARLVSIVYLIKQYEPPCKIVKKAQFSFKEFLLKSYQRNFGRFVLYSCCMNLAVYIAAPFFVPYLLKDLHLDYWSFTMVLGVAMVVKFFVGPIWGKLADRYGTRKILVVTGFLMPLNPLLWIFSSDLWYLLLIQIFSGFIWAGFDIASFNFIFDSTSPEKRATCVAYFNVLSGFSIFLGAFLGGLLVRYNTLFWSKYLLIFIVSCIFRYTASFLFIPQLKEVRHVKNISYPRLFVRMATSIPTLGIIPHYHFIPHHKKKEPIQDEIC